MSSNSSYILTLSTVIRYLSLTFNSATLILGTIGAIANTMIYTAPQLRRNSCAFYLLCANTFQFLSITFSISARMAVDYFDSDLDRQSLIYCKIRTYLASTLPALAVYYMLLSTLDRCLATSNNVGIRTWTQLRTARRLSIITLIFVAFSNIHILLFFTIANNSCLPMPDTIYPLFFAVHFLTILVIFPYILMLILCLITLMNMRRTKRRVAAMSHPNIQRQQIMRRFEVQIIMVITLEVVVSLFLLLLRIGSYIYSLFTMDNVDKTNEERAIENFVIQVGFWLFYFSFGISFYVSTLPSKYFRNILWKRIVELHRRYWRPS